jgi:putative ATP-binding cassette transporter
MVLTSAFDSPLGQFIKQESLFELRRLIFLSACVGISNMALVALLNSSASTIAAGGSITVNYFIFLALILFFAYVVRKSNRENVISSLNLMHRFKMRIMRQVLASDLKVIDDIGRVHILQTLVRDSQTVSQCLQIVVVSLQAIATLIFMLGYLGSMSIVILFTVSILFYIVFLVMARTVRATSKKAYDSWHQEGASFEIFSDFLNGFKEIKMNSKRASEITNDMVYESRITRDMKIDAMIAITDFGNQMQIFSYVILAVLIFVAPILSDQVSPHVMAATTAILFLTGSLTGLISNIPTISQANSSAKELIILEGKLKSHVKSEEDGRQELSTQFVNLKLDGVGYIYSKNSQGKKFELGPITYEFEAGKIYFIRGNNGSGKTTLMRILVGLYEPTFGSLQINGIEVEQPTSKSYRDLFSVVFSDFYLFKKLYGVMKNDPELIDEAIRILEMQNKVSVKDDSFTDINLSTGQKKRLALIIALLEQKQVLVLDEWASDQDPEFRKHFYEKILPKLSRLGKCIIAITHDDQYYSLADHVMVINQGKLA